MAEKEAGAGKKGRPASRPARFQTSIQISPGSRAGLGELAALLGISVTDAAEIAVRELAFERLPHDVVMRASGPAVRDVIQASTPQMG